MKFGPCAIQTNDSLVHILSPTLLLEELPSWRLHFQPCSNKAACNFEVTLIILMEVMCNRHVVSKTGLVASGSSVLYVLCKYGAVLLMIPSKEDTKDDHN